MQFLPLWSMEKTEAEPKIALAKYYQYLESVPAGGRQSGGFVDRAVRLHEVTRYYVIFRPELKKTKCPSFIYIKV